MSAACSAFNLVLAMKQEQGGQLPAQDILGTWGTCGPCAPLLRPPWGAGGAQGKAALTAASCPRPPLRTLSGRRSKRLLPVAPHGTLM